jgi:hypothetical protein
VGVAFVLLAGGAAASTAAAAQLPQASYYGVNIQPLIKESLVPPADWSGFLAETLASNNIQTARMDALWSWAEPSAPANGAHTYIWNNPRYPNNSLDRLVTMLASQHIRMLAVLSTPPAWAAGPGTQLAPAHYGDFVSFAAAFAARYGAGGTFWAQNPQLPYLPVEQFEVWTEANSSNFWTGTPNPAEYLKVLEPLTAAVHAVDPSGQVLASIGWQNFQSYVTQLYQLGGKGSFDGIGWHPYAPDTPGIVLLTEELRSTLEAQGDPNLPIFATEVGQPDAASGPGAAFAYDGPVSDAARAATLSLAGDALAHGDCGVQSYDLYALIGSGTNLEPAQEGWMGLFNYTTGMPNITGSAIIAANQRWQSAPASGLVECGSGTTPASALLPLGVTLTHTGPTCVSAVVTYYGNPLEGAELVLRTADGRVDPAGTNAFGQTQMCLQDGPLIKSFTAYAELSSPLSTAALTAPNIAESPTYTCPVTSAPCTVGAAVQPPSTGSAPPPAVTVVARSCALGASIAAVSKHRTTLRARLTCVTGIPPSATVRTWLERAGSRHRQHLHDFALRSGRWRKFSVAVHLHAGDHIVMTVAANTAIGLPAVQHVLTATRKLVQRHARHAGASVLGGPLELFSVAIASR